MSTDPSETTDPARQDAAPSEDAAPIEDAALLPRGSPLPGETQEDVWALAELARAKGLRFWDVAFEIITRRRMVELGTYVLPYRWAHWTFGREYARMQKLHDLGLVEILELVINTRPARAYLLDANSRDDNRMVIAHVLAHVDFFANNMWFERTPDNILREAHHHERRVRELQELYGRKAVEETLDRALSIQWHVDFYRHYERAEPRPGHGGPDDPAMDPANATGGMTPSDLAALPPRRGPKPMAPPALDPQGHRDLLEFLTVHAPVSELEREVLATVREEMLYFYPNALTKIMNEGWATYWHAELLREYLPFGAFDEFAVKHSHLMQSEGLNPYKLGFLIYEDIRRRGDEELGHGAGLQRIFEVRRYGDDVSFLRDHLTQRVIDAAGLYLYEDDPETGERTITSTRLEDIRPQILGELENLGKPSIAVATGDHEGRGELLLTHRFDGREIDMDYAGDVLKQIHAFWKSPVHLDSQVGGKSVRLSHDGERTRLQDLDAPGSTTPSDHQADEERSDEGPPEDAKDGGPQTEKGPAEEDAEAPRVTEDDGPGQDADAAANRPAQGHDKDQARLPSGSDRADGED